MAMMVGVAWHSVITSIGCRYLHHCPAFATQTTYLGRTILLGATSWSMGRGGERGQMALVGARLF